MKYNYLTLENKMNITPEEQKALDKTSEAWAEFVKLNPLHNDHIHDVRFHIHAIQAIIVSRAYIRQQNGDIPYHILHDTTSNQRVDNPFYKDFPDSGHGV